MVQPRRYSREQIHFVLERLGSVKNSDIIEQYNQQFREDGNQITAKQLKYIRLTYGSDPNFGAVLYNQVKKTRNRRPEPAAMAPPPPPPPRDPQPRLSFGLDNSDEGPAQSYFLPMAQTAVEPFGNQQPGEGYTYPEATGWEQFVRVPEELEPIQHQQQQHQQQRQQQEQQQQPAPAAAGLGSSPIQSFLDQLDDARPVPGPAPSDGELVSGPHGGCPIQGEHRHDQDGGIYFPNLATVLDNWQLVGGTIAEAPGQAAPQSAQASNLLAYGGNINARGGANPLYRAGLAAYSQGQFPGARVSSSPRVPELGFGTFNIPAQGTAGDFAFLPGVEPWLINTAGLGGFGSTTPAGASFAAEFPAFDMTATQNGGRQPGRQGY